MGNTLCCAPSPRTIRIHQEKGKIMELYSPILASKLMREYPNHLIVYRCINGKPGTIKQNGSFNSKTMSPNGEVRVARGSTKLELGHAYFLVHIPEKYLARFSKYFSVTNSQVAPAPAAPNCHPRDDHAPGSKSSAADLALARAGGAMMVKDSKSLSSNSRLQKKKSTRPSKPVYKPSRHRRSPRASPGHKKPSSMGKGLWGGESSSSIISSARRVGPSHEGSQKSSGLTYYRYFRSKYGRQRWKPLLATITEEKDEL